MTKGEQVNENSALVGSIRIDYTFGPLIQPILRAHHTPGQDVTRIHDHFSSG